MGCNPVILIFCVKKLKSYFIGLQLVSRDFSLEYRDINTLLHDNAHVHVNVESSPQSDLDPVTVTYGL